MGITNWIWWIKKQKKKTERGHLSWGARQGRGGSGRSCGDERGVNVINMLCEILKELITIFQNKFKAILKELA